MISDITRALVEVYGDSKLILLPFFWGGRGMNMMNPTARFWELHHEKQQDFMEFLDVGCFFSVSQMLTKLENPNCQVAGSSSYFQGSQKVQLVMKDHSTHTMVILSGWSMLDF